MKRVCVLLSFLMLPIFAVAALAQSVQTLPPMSVITFEPGTTRTTMNGQMVPGGRDLYYVLAKAGQSLNVSITPPRPASPSRSTCPTRWSPAPPTAAR